jgi:hypothetical protein
MPNTRSEIEKQARSATIQYAFFRWENAIVIGGTMLLMFFVPRPLAGWPGWAWPVLGLLGVALIVLSSLTDTETNTKVKLDLLEAQFDLRRLQNTKLRAGVEQALAQQRNLEAYIGEQRAGALRTRLDDIAGLIADWITGIYQLSLRLDAYQRDPNLIQERESVATELKILTEREQAERKQDVKQQLADVIDGKRKQQAALSAVDDRMVRAERQLEQCVTDLATACAQVQSISAISIQSGRPDRLRRDIEMHIAQLNALVNQVSRIYDYNNPTK